jgi:hypothetical protein
MEEGAGIAGQATSKYTFHPCHSGFGFLQEGSVGVGLHHRLDQVELVHRNQLQDFGARFASALR